MYYILFHDIWYWLGGLLKGTVSFESMLFNTRQSARCLALQVPTNPDKACRAEADLAACSAARHFHGTIVVGKPGLGLEKPVLDSFHLLLVTPTISRPDTRHAPVLNTLSPCVSSRRLMFAAGNIFTTTEILSRDAAERRRRVAARCGCGVGFAIMTAVKSDFWTERSAVQRNSSPGFRARDRIIRREAKTVKMVKFIVITHRLPII